MTPIRRQIIVDAESRGRLSLCLVAAGFALGLITTGLLDQPTQSAPLQARLMRIPGPLLIAGADLCRDNQGLRHIDPLGRNRYTFQCRDGAQFVEIEARLGDESGDHRAEVTQ